MPEHVIAVDTETEGAAPWSVQWSDRPGRARMALATDLATLSRVAALLAHSDTLTVVHNAPFDIPVLHALGIWPAHVVDTMVMGYLLGYSPLKLKTLAYRHCGMEMQTYAEVVRPAAERKALRYLQAVEAREWPDPDPELETRPDGTDHVRWPHNIRRKVKRLLGRFSTGEDLDLREKWVDMDGREAVEEAFGPMPPGHLSDIEQDTAVRYACMDADATGRLYRVLAPAVAAAGLSGVLALDMGIVDMVADMISAGIEVDVAALAVLGRDYEREMDALLWEIRALVGHYVNPASPPQVAAALYELRIFTQPGMSTDAETLDPLAPGHPVVAAIQRYRQFRKLLGTYIRALPHQLDAAGRVHTSYRLTVTETGRLSSRAPNLQNIPARRPEGKAIRAAFVAQQGCKLIALDYSQIELRIAAHLSQDPVLLEVYRTGGDIHEVTREAMYGPEPDDAVREMQRKNAKVVNFSTIYLVTPPGLVSAMHHAGVHGVTELDAAQWISRFFQLYRGYNDYVQATMAQARRDGQVRDMFGRAKYVPEIYSTLPWVKEKGLRAAVNFPIQSTAGGIIKRAMAELVPVYRGWQSRGYTVRPLLQVHDELVFEVDERVTDAVVPELCAIMVGAVELAVPVLVDVEVGDNWKEGEDWAPPAPLLEEEEDVA